MSSDIVERLRDEANEKPPAYFDAGTVQHTRAVHAWKAGAHGRLATLCTEAAATIEANRAEIARLTSENFMLAAGCCINPGEHGLVGDEHGNSVCTAYEALRAEETAHSNALAEIAKLRAALEPFAAMGRVMEIRARVTFGKVPKDAEIVFESSGEVGMGVLTMGHFRDASSLLPNAQGWGGVYKALDRQALTGEQP